MRRRAAITTLLILTCLAAAAVARAEISQTGNLRITFNGSFAPQALPRASLAPISVSVEGRLETTDGSQPPVVDQIAIELNRNGRISTRGLPACTPGLLQSTSDDGALARCRPALVGHGGFAASLQTSSQLLPAHGQVLVFNGRFRGRPALLLHFFTSVPVRATLVLPMVISHTSKGRYGTVFSTDIPVLAGGLGSITRLKLEVGRQYEFEGRRRSFLSASCAAPAGFPGTIFAFARGSFHFDDGKTIRTALTRDCTVRGGD